MIARELRNGIEIYTIENTHLRVSIVPDMGGKLISIYNKPLEKEFLWTNDFLPFTMAASGSEYDANFLGGVDELIPNDIPETIDAIDYPDHGELWTTRLKCTVKDDNVTVDATLPLCGLYYAKKVTLDPYNSSIILNYNIRNDSGRPRNFMWKLHAAVNIAAGDRLKTSARYSKVVDPEYSRFRNELTEFKWPNIESTDASVIPERNGSMDFLYLYDTPIGEMQLEYMNGEHIFGYCYDTKVFPYQWWFASYGGFSGHYTAILEPCTNMPIAVKDAIEQNQCASLQPGDSISTTVRIFAGEKKNYLSL